MNEIQVLDCTLRDGGYCNNWKFGFENIRKIIKSLMDADIEIIECGFITDKTSYDSNCSRYNDISQLSMILPQNKNGKIFVAMINYGEYEIDQLPMCDGSSITGIRVAFHKKDLSEALALCEKIKDKGYMVFVQAMVSLNYSDEEFLSLIQRVNQLEPYAFYIVDSFGMMKGKDLTRLFYVVEHNLKESICIGFHSHNNMQLAYSNAQTLIGIQTCRNLVIDSSIYGMGRGAGNLNTELFVEYLNDNCSKKYELKPLLSIIDEILTQFHYKNYWGYSLPNYLSAKHNIHPNYAMYLDSKKTLTAECMDEIFSMIENEKRVAFDENYIESLYQTYMDSGVAIEDRLDQFKKEVCQKEVIIIAPGKSSLCEADKILQLYQKKKPVVISINFEYGNICTDYIFVSNLRRYHELPENLHKKCIVTSNIPTMDVFIKYKYSELTNKYETVRDNAGMMLLNFLIKMKAKRIYLAGIDGYSMNAESNYADSEMAFYNKKAYFEAMNDGMNRILNEYAEQIPIVFLTEPKFINIARKNE